MFKEGEKINKYSQERYNVEEIILPSGACGAIAQDAKCQIRTHWHPHTHNHTPIHTNTSGRQPEDGRHSWGLLLLHALHFITGLSDLKMVWVQGIV